MTRYLSTGPLEDIRRAKKLIEEDTSIWVDPIYGCTQEELYEIAEKRHAKTGSWPSHLMSPNGHTRKIPPQRSQSSRSDSGRK